jgi:hypothetical protein
MPCRRHSWPWCAFGVGAECEVQLHGADCAMNRPQPAAMRLLRALGCRTPMLVVAARSTAAIYHGRCIRACLKDAVASDPCVRLRVQGVPCPAAHLWPGFWELALGQLGLTFEPIGRAKHECGCNCDGYLACGCAACGGTAGRKGSCSAGGGGGGCQHRALGACYRRAAFGQACRIKGVCEHAG